MSRSSRRSLREKSIARRVLEKAVRDEIDEFVNTVVEPRESYEDWDDLDDLDDIFGCIPDEDDWYDAYEDEEDWDDFYDYDYSRDDDYDDVYGYYDRGGPEIFSGDVGTYYKDRENRTYLCCRVHGVTVYVNIHTGRESSVSQFQLEKVG